MSDTLLSAVNSMGDFLDDLRRPGAQQKKAIVALIWLLATAHIFLSSDVNDDFVVDDKSADNRDWNEMHPYAGNLGVRAGDGFEELMGGEHSSFGMEKDNANNLAGGGGLQVQVMHNNTSSMVEPRQEGGADSVGMAPHANISVTYTENGQVSNGTEMFSLRGSTAGTGIQDDSRLSTNENGLGEGVNSNENEASSSEQAKTDQWVMPPNRTMVEVDNGQMTGHSNESEIRDIISSWKDSGAGVADTLTDSNNDNNSEGIRKDEDAATFPVQQTMNSESSEVKEELHEALQPITYKDCCIPAMSTNSPKDVKCFGTCYNEKACNDPIYPFKSADEKAMFPAVKITSDKKAYLQKKCKSPEKMTPPVEWCQRVDNDHHNRTAAHLVENIPPAGCSSVASGGGSGAFQHVLIFPSAKLAFCGIPKVGITLWEQFLRFHIGAKDYPSLPHYKLDRTPLQFDQLDPSAQRRIWEDEEWTWAAFIRDPAERLLSAYLDKVKSKKENLGLRNFDHFVERLSRSSNFTHCDNMKKGGMTGLNWCSDPHWRPQVYSCGLSERLDRFKFIGDIENIAEQTKELLEHVGLWESHGKHFIHSGRKAQWKTGMCNVISLPANETSHRGFQQKKHSEDRSTSKTAYGHSKGSKGKMKEYFNPELLEKVHKNLYADDYKLWKLVSGNGSRLSKGKDLMAKLSSKCTNAHDMNMVLGG